MIAGESLRRNAYTGNGSSTVFAYNFPILAATDLKVYVAGVLQTLTTHYSVSGVGAPSGGNVTFGVAPASNALVVILGDTPETQEADYAPADGFPAETHERGLDKLTMLVHQIREALTRAPALGEATPLGGSQLALPAPVPLALLRWNSGGTALDTVLGDQDPFVVPITTQGDLAQGGVGGVAERLAVGANGAILIVAGGMAAWLAPGTNGKWLTMAAGAPAWQDLPAVLATLVDAKGDLLVGTAADTVARKAVGSNDNVLQPDSAQSDGLIWTPHLQLNGIAAPSTPASGKLRLFSDSGPTGLRRLSMVDASGQVSVVPQVIYREVPDAADLWMSDIVNTASEVSIFSALPTIKANILGIDRTLWFCLHGDLLNSVGTNQGFTVRIKIGGSTYFTLATGSSYGNNATRYAWYIEGLITMGGSTTRHSGRCGFFSTTTVGVSGGDTPFNLNSSVGRFSERQLGTTNFGSDQTFDVTMQPTTASGNLAVGTHSIILKVL